MTGLRTSAFTLREAEGHTNRISYTARQLWRLVEEAYERRIWEAFGLPSWDAYVTEHLDFSRRRAYQLLAQARTIRELESATTAPPVGSANAGATSTNTNDLENRGTQDHDTEPGLDLDLPERITRELSPVLDDVKAEIRFRVARLDTPTGAERQQIVRDVVNEYREQLRSLASTAQSPEADTQDPLRTEPERRPATSRRSPTAEEYAGRDPAVIKSKYRLAFTAARRGTVELFSRYDPEDVVATLGDEDDTMGSVEALEHVATDWFARFHAARRPNLKSLPGGKS